MLNKVILWSLLIVPWLSLIFMKKDGIKTYLSTTIFTALLVTIVYEIAYVYQWWDLNITIVPWGKITNVSYAYGIFSIGTLWIFYLTYKKFWLYLLTNIVIDGIDAFFVTWFMESRKIIFYLNITKIGLFLVMVSLSLLAYGFQKWHEKTFELKIRSEPKND